MVAAACVNQSWQRRGARRARDLLEHAVADLGRDQRGGAVRSAMAEFPRRGDGPAERTVASRDQVLGLRVILHESALISYVATFWAYQSSRPR